MRKSVFVFLPLALPLIGCPPPPAEDAGPPGGGACTEPSEVGCGDELTSQLDLVDGVMIGRAAYKHPAVLAGVDDLLLSDNSTVDLVAAAERMIPYADRHIAAGGRLVAVTRHMLGLFSGRPGARLWRRMLTVESIRPGATGSLISEALDVVRSAGGLAEPRPTEAA